MSARFDFEETPLKGLFVIKPKPICDERGYFERYFCAKEFKELGFNTPIAQINHTFAKGRGNTRGLHFQHPPFAEIKIIRCLRGKIYDIALDVRQNSPTFLQHYALELSEENSKYLYIPQGFAHGLQVLSDEAEFLYLSSNFYEFSAEVGLNVMDTCFKIKLPFEISEISAKDKNAAFIDENFRGVKLTVLQSNDFKTDDKKKPKLLLTGATGFIGTNFVLNLNEKYQITALVRPKSDTSKIEKFCEIYRFDENIEKLGKFIAENKFDGVLHLATLYLKAHHPDDIKALIHSNITFGSELLESLKQVNFKGFFININSFWQLYKNVSQNPLNLYAATKNAFLQILNYYAQTSEILFSNIYLNDTYGENDTRNKIFNLWLNSLKSNQVLEMSGGEQIMDILHIDDILNAFESLINLCMSDLKTLAQNKNFTLHSKERLSLKEVAKIFEKSLNVKLNIKWGAKPYGLRENFIPYEFGDTLPNWQAQISLEEGFKKVFKNQINHLNNAVNSNKITTGGGGFEYLKTHNTKLTPLNNPKFTFLRKAQ